MASKLGELARRGACKHPVFGAAVCPPVFSEVPTSAGQDEPAPVFTKDMLADVVGMCRVVLLDENVSLNF